MADAVEHAVVELPNIGDPARGFLLVAEVGAQLPFQVRRMFVLHDVPITGSRGYHAHREQHQFLVALTGSCTVIVDNGRNRVPVRLDRPSIGVHAPPMLWLELVDFAPSTTCAVLASDIYDEQDYIRDRAEFDRLRGI